MVAQTQPIHRLTMNTFSNNSSNRNNNRQMQLTPMPQKLRLGGSNDNINHHHDTKESRSFNAADTVIELLELLTETGISQTKPSGKKSRTNLKEFISSAGRDKKPGPLIRKHSFKTEPCRTLTKDQNPSRRSSSSMQIKSLSPVDIDQRYARSPRGERRHEMVIRRSKSFDGMELQRRKSLEDAFKNNSWTSTTKTEESSNCSMADNSFFQEANSCLGDFQNPRRNELKNKKEEAFFGDFGFSPSNWEPIPEQQEESSEGSSSSDDVEKQPHSDDVEKRRRKNGIGGKTQSKRPHNHHRKPPQRRSSSEGLVLHSSSAISTSSNKRDEESSSGSTRRSRRRGHCDSAGQIRNNRTNEEYTGFFLTSPGKDNLKNGFGISRFPDGRVFEGLYDHGTIVEGKMTYPVNYQGQLSVTTYIGRFDPDGLRSGKGIYTTPKSTFLGDFYKDEPEGSGILIYHDGGGGSTTTDGAEQLVAGGGVNPANAGHHRRFVGHWKEGLKHGYGKEILADGTVHQEGLWERGRFLKG